MKLFYFAALVAALAHAIVAQSWQSVATLLITVGLFVQYAHNLRKDQSEVKTLDDRFEANQRLYLQLKAAFDKSILDLEESITRVERRRDDDSKSAATLIMKLQGTIDTLEKKHAEVSKVVSTSTIAQAFRPRVKE